MTAPRIAEDHLMGVPVDDEKAVGTLISPPKARPQGHANERPDAGAEKEGRKP